jgi:hypothetical protein
MIIIYNIDLSLLESTVLTTVYSSNFKYFVFTFTFNDLKLSKWAINKRVARLKWPLIHHELVAIIHHEPHNSQFTMNLKVLNC